MRGFILFVVITTALGARLDDSEIIKEVSQIVGGTDAYLGEFPYQVSFQNGRYTPPFHFCGGSIYNAKYIITAAHCVARRNLNNPRKLQVVAGDLNLRKTEEMEQFRTVVRIIIHEKYNASRTLNDIALLKLDEPFEFNDVVKPIELPTQDQNITSNCIVTGWGVTKSGGSPPKVLQKVIVPVVSDEECRKSYSADSIADSMICAGYAEGGKDSCQGDSGGPMVCDGYLGGIVSWGRGCALPGYPGVYTETAYYVDWISDNAV